MEQLYEVLRGILSYVAGEELTLKTLAQLSTEITALIGTGDLSWLAYFAAPINLLSLLLPLSMIYATWFILLYLPWRLFRSCVLLRSGGGGRA